MKPGESRTVEPVPRPVVEPQRPHRCGRCANPFTNNGGNDQCVNAPAAAERRIIIAGFKESPYQELDNGKA